MPQGALPTRRPSQCLAEPATLEKANRLLQAYKQQLVERGVSRSRSPVGVCGLWGPALSLASPDVERSSEQAAQGLRQGMPFLPTCPLELER